jgi:hypothetical protein
MPYSTEISTIEPGGNFCQPNFFAPFPDEILFMFFKNLNHQELLALITTCHLLMDFCYPFCSPVLCVGEAWRPIRNVSKFVIEVPRKGYRLGFWKQPIMVTPVNPQLGIDGCSSHALIITSLSMLPPNSQPIQARSVVFDVPEVLVTKKSLPTDPVTLEPDLLKRFENIENLMIINAHVFKQLLGCIRDLNLKCLHFERCQLRPRCSLNFRRFVHLKKLYIGLGPDFGGKINLPPNLKKLIVHCSESKLFTSKDIILNATSCVSLKYM